MTNDSPVSSDDLLELVRVFEGFSQASTTFSQSYHALESQIAQLREQLEDQVRLQKRTEGFLASVLAHVTAGIIVTDLDGYITLFNEYAYLLTGIEKDTIIGQSYRDFFECHVMEPDSALYTLTNGPVIESREKDLRIRGGKKVPVRFSTTWIHDEHGNRSGVLEIFEDLRVLRGMQARMKENASMAALGEMAAQMAHELRNPLAGVQGFTQFLEEDLGNDHPSHKTVRKIVHGVSEINQIAERLLEFTSPLKPTYNQVDLVNVLREEGDLIEAEIVSRKSNISIFLDVPEEPVIVDCDEHLLRQALLNLLKNAVLAFDSNSRSEIHQLSLDFPVKTDTESCCQIRISLHRDLLRNRVWIGIQDNGHGMPQETLRKVFSPFFTTRAKGSGLGLPMVKKIVDIHRGDIRVESQPGIGTRFEVELPIARIS